MRNEILESISKTLHQNEDIVVLLGDLGTFQMREAMKLFPNRVLNFGIMEQTMIGFAGGLARGGCYPIIYSITPLAIEELFFTKLETFGN